MCRFGWIRPLQPRWNVNHATRQQIGGEHAFRLNYRLDKGMHCRLCCVWTGRELSQGIFLLHFWLLLDWKLVHVTQQGPFFHNKAKNMPEMFSLARSVSVKHENDRTLFPADSISPFPGESSSEIPPFSPDVIFLIGSINWSMTQDGIIAEIYSMSL